MTLAELISEYRKNHNLSQRQMCAQCGLSTGYISLIEKEVNPQTGKPMVPTLTVLNKIATGMGLSLDELIAMCDDMPVDIRENPASRSIYPSNILPMPETKKLPRLGTIACGEPILAEENIEDWDSVPLWVRADFTLKCKGDSMINARIFDGDVVCIHKQEAVDDGEIAAVLIGDEATLKRVHLFTDHIVLQPENPNYRPLSYWEEEMNDVHILGKATYFISAVR